MRAALCLALLLIARMGVAGGQGLAGASVSGTVTAESVEGVSAARVTLTNTATGNVWRVLTTSRGTFLFDNLPVGGPFTLDVRAIGYQPVVQTGIMLHVGDRVTLDVPLDAAQARTLEAIVVRTSSGRDAGAGGPSNAISGDGARRLPLLDRNFIGLFSLSPLTGGNPPLAIGGQHPRFNAIQIDGGSAGDFFGVNATPGGGTGASLLSLEAIDQVRVLVAPFDVRQGGFSGGLINAVTRSGTNRLRVSGFASLAGSDLVGVDTAGAAAQRFASVQYGATVGGPIVSDRLHYFVAAELQAKRAPAISTVDINAPIANRVSQITRDVYGFDPGGADTPNLEQPSWNVFAKLSWQVSPRNLIEVAGHGLNGSADALGRTVVDRNNRDGWALSQSGVVNSSASTTFRARATSAVGAITNELLASYSAVRDDHSSRLHVPLFLVQADSAYIAAGSVSNATGTFTEQRVVELADNLSWSTGSHVLTVGTQNHLLHFRDNFFISSWGVWTFPDADAYERRQPTRYEVALPLRPGGPLADYSVVEAAAYVQDRWAATRRLTLTAGLRVDAPFFDAPFRNDSLAANAALGHIDTGVFPTGNAVLSPRIGFSYELGRRDNAWVLRGGIGSFAGRPPYAWMTNAYTATGREASRLVCLAADGVPTPVTDVTALPSRCLQSAGVRPAVPSVATFAANTHFQQAVKLDLGLEHELGGGFAASIDAIYTRTRNTLTLVDRNLTVVDTSAEGRVMYGTIAANGVARPARVDGDHFGPIYEFQNRTGDRATSISAELHREWGSGAFVQAAYAWSRTEDLISLFGTSATLMFQNNPIDGSIANRRLRRSNRDAPHSFVAAAVVPMKFSTTVSVFFRAHSGTPYAYLVGGIGGGDANADGTPTNDLAYLPRAASDISLADPQQYAVLDSLMQSESCLRNQRGRVMARNSCRNPAVRIVDVRLAKGLRRFEINADVFNLPNLLDRDWGLVRETTNREGIALMSVTGWDAAANRPKYAVALPARNRVVLDASRWRIQLGVRWRS